MAALAAASCSTFSEPLDPPLSGEWTALCGVDVACALKLEEHGTSIGGAYGSSGLLGKNYYASLTGTYHAPAVHLEWTYSSTHESFDGLVQGDTALVGTIHQNGDRQITFYKR